MSENINYREELAAIREALKDATKPYDNDALENMENGMYCCVLIAEQNLQEQRGQYEIGPLAKELLEYGTILEGYDHLLHCVQRCTERMADALSDHPRLKVKLLRLRHLVLQRIECMQDHNLSITEDVWEEISALQRNIAAADSGNFDQIEGSGMLKRDPVEWTARYEEVIDEVEKIVDARLADHPRGMGFCHAYWHELTEVLSDYGIEWRSPSRMNPGVMFD